MDLRAPDPTLASCGLGLIFIEYYRGTYTAHKSDLTPEKIDRDVTVCGKPDRRLRGFEPDAAAYIAVPCQECFPEAPKPGFEWTCPDCEVEGCEGQYAKAFLSWQREE